MPTAIVTGASRGLGFALAKALAEREYALVVDARGADALHAAAAELRSAGAPAVHVLPGDVADPLHRLDLVDAAWERGEFNLLVNNAGILGPSPQPGLADYPLEVLGDVYRVNVLAPLGLIQLALPRLAPGARVLNITSDAAVEAYPGWGGYGSAKAALEQLTNVLAVEHPEIRFHAVDPGDMRTEMHQQAFPGEDISDRPPPEDSVPALLALIDGDRPSGRYRAAELAPA